MDNLLFVGCGGALAAGLFTAYVDFHTTEVVPTLLVILTSTFVLGTLYGRLGWLWALIVAGCLAGAHVLAPRFGMIPRDAGHLGNPLWLMILSIPAAITAYVGAGLRRAMH